MYSIVIPVYRSANILPNLVDRLEIVMGQQDLVYEIILVEDCGGDNTWDVVCKLSQENLKIRGFQLTKNYGQHNALLCGILEAKGNIIITMDDDLQHFPEELPKLIEKIKDGFDVVYGVPEIESHGFLRNSASIITKLALKKTLGATNAEYISAFRIFQTNLRNAFINYSNSSVNIDVLLTWATNNFSFVKVNHHKRETGNSGYSFYKLVDHALNMITGYSTFPLKIASLIGFIFAGFGVLVLAYVLFGWLRNGSSVPGFVFLASLIAIFSGSQLLALGILGEYLSRMHSRIMAQPPFVVRKSTEDEKR